MLLRTGVDRPTPLESVPPVIPILITSDLILVHTLTSILISLTLKYKNRYWCLSPDFSIWISFQMCDLFPWITYQWLGSMLLLKRDPDGALCVISILNHLQKPSSNPTEAILLNLPKVCTAQSLTLKLIYIDCIVSNMVFHIDCIVSNIVTHIDCIVSNIVTHINCNLL